MPSWQEPTVEEIRQTEYLAARPEEQRYFFARLENPLWIDALRDAGGLKPPPPATAEDGATSHAPWPVSGYIARVAGNHPDHEFVATTIGEMAGTSNVMVQRDLIAAMTALEPRAITHLLPAVTQWVSGPDQVFWMLDRVGALVMHALRDSANDDPVRALLDAYFEPWWDRRGEIPAASLRIDDWEIKEFARNVAPQLVEVNGLLLLSVLVRKLDALFVEKFPDAGEVAGAKDDYSTIWLADLTSEEHLYGAEALIAHLAIRTLDGIAASDSADPDEAIGVLDGGAWAIHRRLSLHLLSRCARVETVHDKIIDRLTDASLAGSYQMRREYNALLRAAFSGVSREEQLAILAALASAAEQQGDAADVWLYERLAGVSDHLSDDWAKRFGDYAERFGEPRELPASISFTWESARELSPLSANEAGVVTASRLAAFVRDWVAPDASPFEGPTWRGLAKQVEALAKQRPAEFSAAAAAFSDVNRTVVAAILRGLKDEAGNGDAVDWESVLALVNAVATKNESRDESQYLGFDEDTSWAGAKREASELLQAGLDGKSPPSLDVRSQLWETIELMAANGAAPDRVELDNVHDSVFAALNTTRSQAVYTAVAYLLWLRRSGVETVSGAVDRFFRRILDPESERFVGMRAAVAHQLPQLECVDEDWVARLLPAIFPDRGISADHWDAAWDAYVRYAKPLPSPSVLRALEGHYATAIELIKPDLDVSFNRDPRAHLGIHLAIMVLDGTSGPDHRNLTAFFEEAPRFHPRRHRGLGGPECGRGRPAD